jgi:glycosyltransferase involved in cell wall biosynthesis
VTEPGPEVAVVLPPRETFSSTGSGSVSLLVHRMTLAPSRYRRVVVGAACKNPFTDVPFRGARESWFPGPRSRRYSDGVGRHLGQTALIEVHNRAEVALIIAQRRPGARVSLFLHNDPQTMRGLQTPAQRTLAAARLAGIVCVSQFLADQLRTDAPTATATVLPNCMDLSSLPTPAIQREPLILFVGRLVADKGADAFVEACGQVLPFLPGWRAEMIGADRFSVDSPITPFVAKLRPEAVRAGVQMSGYQPFPQCMQAMARAAIVVVPSRWQEPFGLTALEAMANGAALICSGRGGLAEVVGDVALPCDPDDPSTIAAAIRHLAANPDERAARGAAGWARAGLFDLRMTAAALDAYRDGLLGKDGSPR